MVFRHLFGHVIREVAQQRLQDATESAREAAERNAELRCDVLVVMALPIESGGLVDLLGDVAVVSGDGFTERIGTLKDTHTVGILETGPGESRAASATAEVIRTRQPQWIISSGFAGGLCEGVARGDFVMGETLQQQSSGDELSVGLTMDRDALAASPGVHVGRLLTVDRIIRSSDEKRQLGNQHDALACDMESFAVAKCSAAARTRFLSVRVISDAVDDELPKEIDRLLNQKTTAAQWGAAAAALWNRPSSAKDMWKLKEDALAASDRLAKFLVGVITQLPIDRRNTAKGDPDGSVKKTEPEA